MNIRRGLLTAVLLLTACSGGNVEKAPEPSPSPPPVSQKGQAKPAQKRTTVWAAAPAAAAGGSAKGFAGFTIRNVLHPTAGGNGIRVRLSNRFGDKPVLMGHVTVALSAYQGKKSDGTAKAGTVRTLLFGGQDAVTVAPGAEVLSDRVELGVRKGQDLLVTVWTPKPSGRVTFHPRAVQESWFTRGPGDHAGDTTGTAFNEATAAWYYVSAVEVDGGAGTVVALGDSITEGIRSGQGRNARWTDFLAGRLAGAQGYGVANAGISGNRITLDAYWPKYTPYQPSGPKALSRAGKDAFDVAGARTVVIELGINDIQQWPHKDAAAIIAGLRQLCLRARERGLRVVVGTLTPWYGWETWSSGRERARTGVNAWIRDGGDGAIDAVADFDAAVRDPARPLRLRSGYDSGDHLHPNAAGDKALAAAVPLARL